MLHSLTLDPSHRAVVVKSIRLKDGVGAEKDLPPGALVLQLVRDPRAVTRSERKNFDNTGGASAKADNITKARAVGLA